MRVLAYLGKKAGYTQKDRTAVPEQGWASNVNFGLQLEKTDPQLILQKTNIFTEGIELIYIS